MLLAHLSDLAAVRPEEVAWIRTYREGSGPVLVLARLTGIDAPLPLSQHDDEAGAEAALDAAVAAVNAEEKHLIRLPRVLAAREDELLWLRIGKEQGGWTLTVRLDSDDRALVLASFADKEAAAAALAAAGEALHEAVAEFVTVAGGVVVRAPRVRRVELRAGRDAAGQPEIDVLLRLNVSEQRVPVARVHSPQDAEAAGEQVRLALFDGDDDAALRPLGGGWSARPDGIKALRVRRQVVGPASSQQALYATVLVADDDEEVVLDYSRSPEEAARALSATLARYEAKVEPPPSEEQETPVDWGDSWGEGW